MRYWHTYLDKKTWLKSDLKPTEIMKKYHMEECYVNDADSCGSGEVCFIFDNGKAFKLSYDWYITYNPEWDIHNDFEIEEIDPASFTWPKDKDWLLG